MADDIRVGCEVAEGLVHRSRSVRLTKRVGHVARTHPSVSVPLGLSVAKSEPVHHALAREPVVRTRIGSAERIRSDAQVTAIEMIRNRARHGEVGNSDLLVNRTEVGLETFDVLVDTVQRCIDAGRFDPGEALSRAIQVWGLIHGLVTLSLAQLLTAEDAMASLRDGANNLFLAFGDSPDDPDR